MISAEPVPQPKMHPNVSIGFLIKRKYRLTFGYSSTQSKLPLLLCMQKSGDRMIRARLTIEDKYILWSKVAE